MGRGLMVLVTRCFGCRELLWLWQSQGWLVSERGVVRWHGRCRVEARKRLWRQA
jgi:hypothetical protein